MENQKSVGKRIIWAVSMVVLCTFLTFLMSMFLDSAFPEMNIIYKGGIPVLVFVVLGVANYGIENFYLPFINGVSVPKGVKRAFPIIIIGIGLLLQQMYFDEYSDAVAMSELFQNFVRNGRIYDGSDLTFQGIYQSGLNVVSVLFGYTVFAVSVYNRLYILLSAVLLYFAVKIVARNSGAANVFLVFFLFSRHTLELMTQPETGVVYLLMISLFLLSVSSVFYFRTRTQNFIAQIIAVFVMGCLFAVLFVYETNSIIFALPAIAVSFSGRQMQEKMWYYILAVEGMVLILITCGVIFILKPEIVINLAFEWPSIQAIDFKTTTLLILNMLGFMGVYGMWRRKIYYIIPAFMSIYFIFVEMSFSSGISGELIEFVCVALYATLGLCMFNDNIVEDEQVDEQEDEQEDEQVDEQVDEIEENTPVAISTPITVAPATVVSKPQLTSEEKKTWEEIQSIKALNEKLNQKQSEFVPLTFKKPKQKEKKLVDYAFEPTLEQMKYDIEVADNDDFDI